MSLVAGCDVGSLTSKAVILKEGKIISSLIIKSKANPVTSAEEVMSQAVEKADLKREDIEYIVGTGYGRDRMEFAGEAVSEIACHARGASWLVPGVTTVVDIGGQDCKVIKIDTGGKVEKFITNDKCASGTGRFLEVMAKLLQVDLDELGRLSAQTKTPVILASTCTVWAQADIIKFINSGHSIEDIGAGINFAMAKRVSTLVGTIGAGKDICVTGGVSKNEGVLRTMEKLLGTRIRKIRKADPQLAGAIGAALIAADRTGGK